MKAFLKTAAVVLLLASSVHAQKREPLSAESAVWRWTAVAPVVSTAITYRNSGGDVETLEGSHEITRISLLEFDDGSFDMYLSTGFIDLEYGETSFNTPEMQFWTRPYVEATTGFTGVMADVFNGPNETRDVTLAVGRDAREAPLESYGPFMRVPASDISWSFEAVGDTLVVSSSEVFAAAPSEIVSSDGLGIFDFAYQFDAITFTGQTTVPEPTAAMLLVVGLLASTTRAVR